MPALAFDRQPDPLAWFGSERAQPLLAAERPLVESALARRQGQPWLWLAPPGVAAPDPLPPRLLLLHAAGAAFEGPLRCALPLPLPTEAVGGIVLQHVLEGGHDELLHECARVLEPGGKLWLLTLNPWSPYRARWRRSGLLLREPGAWRERLQAAGLEPGERPLRRLGPVWRMQTAAGTRSPPRLRAVCMIEAEKRVASLIPPAPAKRAWHTGAAPA